jgi:NAD-dependent dihydropyrimidine dehydrogenase PreA subunit
MLRYLANVVTLDLHAKLCNGCGMCVTVCPHRVFQIAERKTASHGDESCLDCGACTGDDGCLFEPSSRKAVIVDRDACIECGACALNCPVEAIRVRTGTGCATAVLLGAIGRSNECSAPTGCAPSGKLSG